MLRGPQHEKSTQAVPVWLAALFAAECLATDGSLGHAVPWVCASGRAVYTNAGPTAQRIEPLGVSLEGGQTLAVWWRPGETAYSVEVYGPNKMCAPEGVWADQLRLNTSLPAMETPHQGRSVARYRRRTAPAPIAVGARGAAGAA